MKILGVDYGRRKIGVAVGDSGTKLVEPIKVLPNLQFTIYNLQAIINNQDIKKIVMGVPYGRMDSEVKTFGERLQKLTGMEVEYFDETLSTKDAQRVLIESGGKRKRRKKKEDAVAAAVMLQWYLETRLH